MSTALLSPELALSKLLAIEPETKDRLINITGWPVPQTEAVLKSLIDAGQVSWRNMHMSRFYFTTGSQAERMVGAA
jgi:hypothetical protein